MAHKMLNAALKISNIIKDFPGVRALDGASLRINEGEVHGLVGENGAGKSTIIKVLAGVYAADAGKIEVLGNTLDSVTPTIVHDAGVRFIHQELHLVQHFTVAESVFMGQERGSWLGLSKGEMRRQAEAFFKDKLAIDISGDSLVRDLSTAQRKLVQIARALIDGKARIVVFDEPTAPLASEEVHTVMAAIQRLKDAGISILYVSHYLDEITEICDRVTVFRQGQDVAVLEDVDENSGPEMVSAMVGREIDSIFPHGKRQSGEISYEVTRLEKGNAFKDVSFEVREGEIFGIAGLIGSGREELVDCLYGLSRITSGEVRKNGEKMRLSSAADVVEQKVVLVPRDRRHDGLVLPMTVSENITLAILDRVSRSWLISNADAVGSARAQIEKLDIRPPAPGAVTRFLSGGNQQKVVLGRWLAKQADVFILDEPTVGVDIGAKVEIYQLIAELSAEGATIIVSSTDPGELIGLCDRVAVMRRGRLSDIVATDGLSIDQLVGYTTGALDEEAENAA